MHEQSRLLRRCRGIECDIVDALERYNVYTVRDFFSRTCWDLQEILNLPLAKVQDVITCVARATSPSPTNVCLDRLTSIPCIVFFVLYSLYSE